MDFSFSPEEERIRLKVRQLSEEKLAPIADEVDESDSVSPEVVRILAEENLFRYVIPEEYGGYGIKVINLCIIREELARICGQADTTFIMQGLGTYPITLAGTEEQKRHVLPSVASGEKLATFALTEPQGGSDVVGMTTTATQEGEEWVLNGSKKFISQTGDAHVYTVFAKTDPESGSRGISAFVVEKGTPGFDDSHKLKLMMAHSIGEPHFDNCRLPYTSLIGERGQGIRIALGTLNTFRTTVGAAAVGMGQAAFEEALKYAKDRTAFGQHLSDFQAIQFKLADMAVSLDAARLLAYRAAWLRDTGTPTVIKESSFAKLFATEAASQIVNESLQIHGGAGLEKGRRIERLYREVRACTIYEGASEIQRLTIARQLLREE